MQEVLRQLDIAETGPTTVVTGTTSRVNNPNDGFATINVGRRLKEVGLRENISDRNVWRMALGMRGDVGSVSDSFLSDLAYDVYYTFARTQHRQRVLPGHQPQPSNRRNQRAVLCRDPAGEHRRVGDQRLRPVCSL
jgi:hypothetical protein